MVNKGKILFEKFYPIVMSLLITAGFYFFKPIDTESISESFKESDILLIIATSLLAALITHKSLILSMDDHKGFKKLLTGEKISKRFFSYMNCVIHTSILFIIYSILTKFFDKLFCLEFVLFLSVWLIAQFIRFIRVFNIVFEKSILLKNDTKEK